MHAYSLLVGPSEDYIIPKGEVEIGQGRWKGR